MIDLHDFAAIGGLITGAWRPLMFAATTLFGGFLVTAMFPKDALGRIEGGVKSLVSTGMGRLHAGPERARDAMPATADLQAAPAQWVEYACEAEPEPAHLSEPEAPEPAEAEAAADTGPAPAADGEPILGRYCKMDTATTVEGLEFTIEVPGIKESDLEIRMVGDTIVISGQSGQDRTDKTFRVVEREYGPFSRFIKVSEGVPLHRIQASLDRGLLTVFVPNPTVQVGGTIAINSAVRRIFDGDGVYELKLDLPGVDAADVDLAVRDGLLTISRRDAALAARADDQTDAAPATRLLQSMELPAGVDADQIRARLAKGVLTVTLPIAAGHRKRTIPLDAAEPVASDMSPKAAERPPSPPAPGRRQPEGPSGAQTPLPFDFWIVGQSYSGNCGPNG